ncbi:hypothetical protein SORBI_3003G170800 [Sorghum bicolor]|uniref:Uncharacterized protein n=1 Tax=Sorghum bicolor TaxID=4558 RepID=A0A1B6Q3S0_SORBI|nr:hypothetical protein SORBI_3003G170800 [Sorghum bicolor]
MVGRFTDQIEGEEDKPGVAATGAVVVARGAGPSAGSRAARGELEARTRAGSVAAVRAAAHEAAQGASPLRGEPKARTRLGCGGGLGQAGEPGYGGGMGLRRRDGVAWPACSGAVNSGRRGTPEDGAAATGWGAGGRAGAGVGFGGAEERQGAAFDDT